MNNALKPADILVPKESVDMEKWAVIACDQYTSEPEYWNKTAEIVGNDYSSLFLKYIWRILTFRTGSAIYITQWKNIFQKISLMNTRIP